MTSQTRIAYAVLALAVDDADHRPRYALAASQQLAELRQLAARTFLQGGPMLSFWCAVAGVSASTITRRARQRWPG